MTVFKNTDIGLQDSSVKDAFGRLRVSEPFNTFDSQFNYTLNPLFWEEDNNGNGAISHQPNTSEVRLTTGGTVNNDEAIFQTKRYFRYQPGKALKHGEPVLSINGWVKIEDIKVGDKIFDGNGNETKVIGVYPQGIRKIYRVVFDDDTHVDVDGEHLWKTLIRRNKKEGQTRVLTTNKMLEEHGENPTGFNRWRIPASPVLNIKERKVDIDPYTLGAFLGDGHLSNASAGFTTADKEIISYLKCEKVTRRNSKYGYGLCGLYQGIRKYGLVGSNSLNKFIPNEYKFNSKKIRLLVLQGLMDTDGSVDKDDGTCEYNSASKQLADDLAFLVRSLGGQAKIKQRKASYTNGLGEKVVCDDSYRVRVIISECPFKLERKAYYWKPRTRISFDRYIHSIKELGKYEATCIRVESEDSTFLTRNLIVTHNSNFITFTSTLGAKKANVRKRIGLFDDENGLFFEQDGSNLKVVRRTKTSGSAVDNVVNQSSWNLDVLDGNGASGLTLETTKDNIFVIDYQWLGAGRVRMGFDFNGEVVYCHEFINANVLATPYMTTGNLPFRIAIKNTATAASSTDLSFFCIAVSSEAGFNPLGIPGSTQSTVLRNVTTVNDPLPIISIRPRTSFNSITNRGQVIPKSYSITNEDATVSYQIILNGSLTNASFADVNTTNSLVMVDVAATAITGGLVVDGGFVTGARDKTESGSINEELMNKLALFNDKAGTTTDILTIAISIINSAGTASDCGGSFTWKELY